MALHCPQCGNRVASRKNLARHLSYAHGTQTEGQAVPSQPNKDVQPVQTVQRTPVTVRPSVTASPAPARVPVQRLTVDVEVKRPDGTYLWLPAGTISKSEAGGGNTVQTPDGAVFRLPTGTVIVKREAGARPVRRPTSPPVQRPAAQRVPTPGRVRVPVDRVLDSVVALGQTLSSAARSPRPKRISDIPSELLEKHGITRSGNTLSAPPGVNLGRFLKMCGVTR